MRSSVPPELSDAAHIYFAGVRPTLGDLDAAPAMWREDYLQIGNAVAELKGRAVIKARGTR